MKLSLCFIKHQTMKAYGGVDVQLHAFLTSALGRGKWSVLRPASLFPGEERWYPLDRRLCGFQFCYGLSLLNATNV
jgi:hypothetical protein